VTRALQEFIARREQRRVAELFGKLEWDSAYDYKAERARKSWVCSWTRPSGRWLSAAMPGHPPRLLKCSGALLKARTRCSRPGWSSRSCSRAFLDLRKLWINSRHRCHRRRPVL